MSDEIIIETLRSTKRLKVFQPAEMRVGGELKRIHLLDLSRDGALAHCPSPPPEGTIVKIAMAGFDRRASVQWSKGNRFGLRFTAPLEAQELARIIPLMTVPAR